MVRQYLIDWESLIPNASDSCSERIVEQVLRLATIVRRNGCLIKSTYTESSLKRLLSQSNHQLFKQALSEMDKVYQDFGLRVDSIDSPASNSRQTIDKWRLYLRETGVSFGRNDARCVVVGSIERGDFYCGKSLDDVLRDRDEWTRLQHFEGGTYSDFTKYIGAFSATAKDYIRIYDPYLAMAFDCVVQSESKKAWRNSLYYLLGVFLKNRHVKKFDVITSLDLDRLETFHLDEVIEDMIRPLSGSRGDMSADLSFHFIDNQRSFHDRFLVNGRFCFAIGHGCDVCEVDEPYRQTCIRSRRGESVLNREWRNMPRAGEFEFSAFNVFYGCSKTDAPDGVPVFNESRADSHGEAPIFPKGCHARNIADVIDRFIGNNEPTHPVLCVNNRINVFINPLTVDEDF